jgi:methylated-DNA-[protein]-cysteine S-methyltransferase
MRTARAFTTWQTAIGSFGIAWGEHGIVGVLLPDAREMQTPAYLLRRFPGAVPAPPPSDVARAMTAMTALLDGDEDADARLADVVLDLDGVPAFHRRVYAAVRDIPPGRTQTYGEVAARVGDGAGPGAAQAVGQAMASNPFPIVVPCHRVVAANGRPGGFSAAGGVEAKLRMLRIEGAPAGGAPTLF